MWTTSVTLTFVVALARSVAEAVLLACNSYLPGARRRKLNLPDSSEVADLFAPVSRLTRRMMALGKTAPEGSNATPVKAPVEAVWAETHPASSTAIAAVLKWIQCCGFAW